MQMQRATAASHSPPSAFILEHAWCRGNGHHVSGHLAVRHVGFCRYGTYGLAIVAGLVPTACIWVSVMLELDKSDGYYGVEDHTAQGQGMPSIVGYSLCWMCLGATLQQGDRWFWAGTSSHVPRRCSLYGDSHDDFPTWKGKVICSEKSYVSK